MISLISSWNLCHEVDENDIKHDRICKSVTEIKDHAKNFPNAPRSMANHFYRIKWPPSNVSIFITHVRNLRNGFDTNDPLKHGEKSILYASLRNL